MKKLGLVGGTGPESTVPYYRGIVYGAHKRTGRFPALTIESVSVFDVLDFCGRKDYGGLLEYLLNAVKALAAAGAELAALTGNTPHIVFPWLQARSPIPLVSMVEASCQEAERLGQKRLALLGTSFTMEEAFFKTPFQERGIAVAVPSPEERRFIDETIRRELELGVVTPEARRGFDAILRRMEAEEQVEAAILGCTELPLLYQDRSAPLPLLDTMEIHIQALIQEITERH